MLPARRLLRVVVAVVSLVPSLAALAGAQEWTGPIAFEVRVEDGKGEPVAAAVVALQTFGLRVDDGPAPLLTDARGRLAVGGLAPGTWSVEVRKEGFLTFRAEIAIAPDAKPQVVQATQQNVPGARGVMRVRFAKLRDAPAARPVVVRAPEPPAASPAPAPPARVPPPAAPAPEPKAMPQVTPKVAPRVEPDAPRPPSPATAPVPASPPATPATQPPVERPQPATPPVPVPEPEAAPAPLPTGARGTTPPAPTPAPSTTPVSPPAPAPPRASRPAERTCHECRPGESAIFTEADLPSGATGGCPADLRGRLESTDFDGLLDLVAGVPSGCAVLRVDLPRAARYTGFRYEVRSAEAPPADCFPGRECAGGGRFVGEPLVRKDDVGTLVFAIYEDGAPVTAGFTVYWARAR